MSSKRTPNSTVRIGYDPAVVNDSTKLFTTRLGTQRFTQRFSARPSEAAEAAKPSASFGTNVNGSIMMINNKGDEIKEENDPCWRISTVRFADGNVDVYEEKLEVEETSYMTP